MFLSQRSQEPEWMDLGSDYYTPAEYQACLRELLTINQRLGIVRDIIHTLRPLAPGSSVVDIGCGGGLLILKLAEMLPQFQFVGVDIEPQAIEYAQNALTQWQTQHPNAAVQFQLQNTPAFDWPDRSVDVIIATLVCHHLSDEALIDFLQRTFRACRQKVILHDLHRHFLAATTFRLLRPWLCRSRLIKHDGLISIHRSFVRRDWERLLKAAAIPQYQIRHKWPFRWEVIL